MTKILIVDNEKDTCDFVQNFFSQRGFKVFCALNGHRALEIVRKESPHIILLDIRMGEMSGIETLKKIRGIDKAVRVIMVSAVDEQDKMDAARELGAERYITKLSSENNRVNSHTVRCREGQRFTILTQFEVCMQSGVQAVSINHQETGGWNECTAGYSPFIRIERIIAEIQTAKWNGICIGVE